MTALDQDVPSCRIGYTCASRGWRPEIIHQHLATCPMSDSSAVHRQARIDALTFAEMRTALTYLAAADAVATDVALADADTVRDLKPEHMPEGAL